MAISIVPEDREGQLVATALAELRANTDITQLTPGAKARALLETVMRTTNSAYRYFDRQLLQAFVKHADGNSLDLIGELMGVYRSGSSRAEIDALASVQKFYVEGNLTFGSINSSNPFTIPAGTEISNRPPAGGEAIIYTVDEDVTCSAAATYAYASVSSKEFGVDANVGAGTLIEHDFEGYTNYLDDTLKTTNVESIYHAREAETDDNFRYRIVNQTRAAEAANSMAIRLAALSIPGVADVFIDEYAFGIGSGALYVESVVIPPGRHLIGTVQRIVNGIKALGSLVEVLEPPLVGVEMSATLNLRSRLPTDEDLELRGRVIDRVQRYINDLGIGGPLELDELKNTILGTDTVIKSIGTTQRPIDTVYIWRDSLSTVTESVRPRYSQKLLNDYYPLGAERVVVEFGEVAGTSPIKIYTREDVRRIG